jgi:MFS family permease
VRVTPAGGSERPDAVTPSAERDRRLLYLAAFLRSLATGMVGVLAGLYLAQRGLSPSAIGVVVGAGLAGMAVATLLVTLRGDRVGRRRALIALALTGAAGTSAVAWLATPIALAVTAFLAMLNGMGRDRGAALVLEQAVLPATVADAGRTRAFAWYNVVQDAGHASGSLLAGLPAILKPWLGVADLPSLQAMLLLNAALSLLATLIYLRLSPAVEAGRAPRLAVSRETRPILARISALFFVDSLGGGFLTTAALSLIFASRFGVGVGTLGPLFFGARILNALSHLAAAWLARRIGLLNTMVFTHIPSSLLLVTVAVAPSFPIAAVLFLLREGLVEMDVPTRQSYVMAVVRPEERTVASGVTGLVRTGAWAIGPAVAGVFMQGVSLMSPLVIGAAIKIVYDVSLWSAFRHVRPPEETARPGA